MLVTAVGLGYVIVALLLEAEFNFFRSHMHFIDINFCKKLGETCILKHKVLDTQSSILQFMKVSMIIWKSVFLGCCWEIHYESILARLLHFHQTKN